MDSVLNVNYILCESKNRNSTVRTNGGLLFRCPKEKQKGLRYNDYCFALCFADDCVCEGCPVRAPGPIGLCLLRRRTLPCAGSGWVLLIFALTLTLRARDAAQMTQRANVKAAS